ncbi:MAG: carbohydrate kinase family protein [Anaerolineae bacterium]
MSAILVSGLINIEVTLRVDGFPIEYTPVRYPFFGIEGTVSGVGYNIAKALTTLGDQVCLLSLIGQDLAGRLARAALEADGVTREYVVDAMPHTARSVILYDGEGQRQINVDLKDVQERTYPQPLFQQAIRACSMAVLCNVNFSRPFLHQARELGVPIATDVHTISDLEDDFNQDFLAAADILFMSDEALPCQPEEWIRAVTDRYRPHVAVIGLGAEGALLAVREDDFIGRVPAVRTLPIVNTIGAGDALFSAFIHFYHRRQDPYESLRKAVVFAAHKIGEAGAADGFLDEASLNALYAEVYSPFL